MRAIALILAALVLVLPPTPVRADEGEAVEAHEEWLGRATWVAAANRRDAGSAMDPLTAVMVLCQQMGCAEAAAETLTAEEAAGLRSVFEEIADAAAERVAIGRAIALFEHFAGGRNGTWRDHAGNQRLADEEPGQLDCVAEAINTRTYLDRLERAGLLRFHRLGGFIHRYAFLLQHVAVEISETDSGDSFAVDSWVGANGEEPTVQPYGVWRMEWQV